jgi:hypothetical protein
MISTRANPLLAPLEGVGPENLAAISGPKKVSICPPLLLALVMDVAHIKIITSGAI